MIVQTVKFFKLVFVLNSVRLSLFTTLNWFILRKMKFSKAVQRNWIISMTGNQWKYMYTFVSILKLHVLWIYCGKNQRRASIWLVRVCREQVIRGQSTINNRFGRIYRSSLYILQNRIIILDPWHELKKRIRISE